LEASNHAKTRTECTEVDVEVVGIESMMIEKSAIVGENIDGDW
jgi:hypothetical protein